MQKVSISNVTIVSSDWHDIGIFRIVMSKRMQPVINRAKLSEHSLKGIHQEPIRRAGIDSKSIGGW